MEDKVQNTLKYIDRRLKELEKNHMELIDKCDRRPIEWAEAVTEKYTLMRIRDMIEGRSVKLE